MGMQGAEHHLVFDRVSRKAPAPRVPVSVPMEAAFRVETLRAIGSVTSAQGLPSDRTDIP